MPVSQAFAVAMAGYSIIAIVTDQSTADKHPNFPLRMIILMRYVLAQSNSIYQSQMWRYIRRPLAGLHSIKASKPLR